MNIWKHFLKEIFPKRVTLLRPWEDSLEKNVLTFFSDGGLSCPQQFTVDQVDRSAPCSSPCFVPSNVLRTKGATVSKSESPIS